MAVIEPFRGLRYNPDKVGDPNRVMAPPYDIISGKEQEELYAKHPCNVIRLELGRTTSADTEQDNRYTRSAADLRKWFEEGVLLREEKPVLYSYFMDYKTAEGKQKILKGFLSRVLLEDLDSGVVLPHENTLSGPKADRLQLMEATHANFSPIFSLYSNPGMEAIEILDGSARKSPCIDVTDGDGVRHRVWTVDSKEEIDKIRRVLADLPLFIADGHHRYETALNFRNMMRKITGKTDGRQGFDYVMMYFSNMEEGGLTIYPTHRLVDHLINFNLPSYLEQVAAHFDVRPYSYLEKKKFLRELNAVGKERHAFGLYTGESDDLFLLVLKNMDGIRPLFGGKLSSVLQELDVTILHTILLDRLLGIGEKELKAQSHVRYVKEIEDALHTVNDGDAQLAFLLNGTRVNQLREVSLRGEKMPQKSTYFYPKLLTGLVLNSLDD
ncbi:MAG: DUF1015 domain-containing protein [Deltaproteobacteria bacterium]|nr:DUF1015 domain-containing protein [Deltaproteobacteria bacterium]